jgi:4-hydroxythreonine-4-phosphate dehydrogenase
MKPLAVSTGDPGGVGPEIALLALLEMPPDETAVLYGDANWLGARAAALGLGARVQMLPRGAEGDLRLGHVGLVDIGVRWDALALSHAATAEGGRAQVAALDAAIEAALAGRVRALCTAPMSKAAATLGGHDFMGHTEHLARACGLADDAVTMMFLGPRLRVALATTHVAVRDLPAAVTRERVTRAIVHLAEALVRLQSGAALPATTTAPGAALHIAVTGLNPHAGEAGLFGDEEPRSITPGIVDARAHAWVRSGGVLVEGPLGAETALRFAASGQVQGVVAMTHDQATIASKLLDWGDAVNVTWGLPFVRTSVDHGVAYDAAASGAADAQGMRSALEMARVLAAREAGAPV